MSEIQLNNKEGSETLPFFFISSLSECCCLSAMKKEKRKKGRAAVAESEMNKQMKWFVNEAG